MEQDAVLVSPNRQEADAVAESAVDDILFYMQEYGGEKFTYSEIAKIFSDAYNKLIKQIKQK